MLIFSIDVYCALKRKSSFDIIFLCIFFCSRSFTLLFWKTIKSFFIVRSVFNFLFFRLFSLLYSIHLERLTKMTLQQYCLRWKYHHSNLQTMFSQLLDRGCFCDVTLACEGQTIRAHRVVLCACSTYFDSILTNRYTDKDPIVIMKGCKFDDIRCLIEFMYKGEINVEHVSVQFS